MKRCWHRVRPLTASLLSLGLLGCTEMTNETGRRFSETGRVIAMGGGEGGAENACFTCHGLDGMGDGAAAPRLAGLTAGYMHKQLEDYAAGTRSDPVMSAVSKPLDADARRAVSAWYASLPAATPGVAPSASPAAYLRGDPSRGLTACSTCHGLRGEGAGLAGPAIAAQPAAYTLEQLRRWRSGERRNDPRGVMRAAALALTPAEAREIALWLQSSPASPAPASAAAIPYDAAPAPAGSATFRAERRLG